MRVALIGRKGASKLSSALNRLFGKSDSSRSVGDGTEIETVLAALSRSGNASFMFSSGDYGWTSVVETIHGFFEMVKLGK